MALRIFNTLTGEKEAFEPIAPPRVGIYVCGPTVYNLSHVGNARPYVVFDVVVRHLRASGFQVTYVRNYTDVDDKILRRAAELGCAPKEVSERYIAEYLRDMEALGVRAPDVSPRVTEHIPEIVALIERLIDAGLAYRAGGDVYFAVRKMPSYGRLSHRRLDDLKAGARVEPGELKEDPLDFALWKAAKPGEISWAAPFGAGRPGWHIECSAMSARYLGETFDLHGGGIDLIFPHHENELAQSEGASGKLLARVWMHNGFVNWDEEKMSKSVGNVFTIREVTDRYEPEALRLLLLGTHYRSPINFSDHLLAEAEKRLDYFYETLEKARVVLAESPVRSEGSPRAEFEAQVQGAMDDDFNTAQALGVLSAPFSRVNELCERSGPPKERAARASELATLLGGIGRVAAVLGLVEQNPRSYLERRRTRAAARIGVDRARVEELIALRGEARQAKDFSRADALRRELLDMGVEIMDGAGKTSWRLIPG
jgi:cysteinyl-tRNA synthetase